MTRFATAAANGMAAPRTQSSTWWISSKPSCSRSGSNHAEDAGNGKTRPRDAGYAPRCCRGLTLMDRDLTRLPSLEYISAMIVRAVALMGIDTHFFSGICARKGGLSTAIENGMPEEIVWMQSGHANSPAARRYVELGSPALLYRTWEAFKL